MPSPSAAGADTVVATAAGRVRGRPGAWLGIPYGAPPVGARRWQPPAPADAWTGELDATRPGPPAPQPKRPISAFAHGATPPGSEDCLTLNVYAPRTGEGPWPVLVWAIGGGWTIGWAGSGVAPEPKRPARRPAHGGSPDPHAYGRVVRP